MKRIALVLIAVTMLSLAFGSSVRANDVAAYVNFDKTEYRPGEQGTITITIRNAGTSPIEVRNVTLAFAKWMMYTEDGWDPLGNQTIRYSTALIIASNTTDTLDTIRFTVPTDGRAGSTRLDILVYTDKPAPIGYSTTVNVVDSSTLSLLRALDNMVTILALVAVSAIIAAVIIAAVVFLSARRPSVTWQKEE